jgi:dihydroorotate dehydrogenase (NAD+) catalytic subunit
VTAVSLFGTTFQNPVLLASGTAAFGREVSGVIDLDALGGIVTKAVTPEPRWGNPPPRVAEFAGGMLNSVGLANPGLAAARSCELPWLAAHLRRARVLVNVAGETVDDYARVIEGLADLAVISAFEINASCPNTDAGGLEFGATPDALGGLVRRCRRATVKPIVVKLSPVTPDPVSLARVAKDEGADAVTLVNTIPGMLDARLGGGAGGVSGPALLPVGVLATKKVRARLEIPVIGVGGIRTASDARAYLGAGASLVAVGTAALADPRAPERIIRELDRGSG